jgi:hypothetical protein
MSEDYASQPAPLRPVPPAPAQANGLGTASFVLGIIALPLSLIPLAGWIFGFPVACTGLGVGLGNIPRLRSGKAGNSTQTWVGVGLSAGAILISLAYVGLTIFGIVSQP